MKCLVLFLIFLTACQSQPVSDLKNSGSQEYMKFFLYEDEHGELQVEHLVNVTLNLTSSAQDVAYYYFGRSNPLQGVEIHSNNINALRRTTFNSRRDTIFIIHGWKNSNESDVNSHIREYIIRDHDVNIFVVDWSVIAERNYISAQGSVRRVGGYIADFAKDLQSQFGLNLRNLKFVGHSLGAHIAGCAGAALGGLVDRIVGLDPAGPLFSLNNIDNRIDSTDAQTVQIIHTNDGRLGFDGRMGDADFYPNGGRSQPGCGVDLTGSCAHSRAYAYYAESLTSSLFVAQRCNDYAEYTGAQCRGARSSMGMFNVDTSASGEYFLDTNRNAPWAKG